MKHLRYLLMAALVAMPLTACDEDTDTVAPDPVITGTVTGSVTAEGDALSGVTVTLVGVIIDSDVTDDGGSFSFENVEAGSYGVSISAPANLDVVFPQTALTTTITTASEIQTVDFAGSYIRTASVTGTVTAGDPLAGVSVNITGFDGVDRDETTNLGGGYTFGGLRAGDYTVSITGYPADALFATTSADVSVSTGGSANASFAGAMVELGSISGAVTVDGVPAVAVAVTLSGDADLDTQTGANGAYSFMDLAPGAYTVTIVPPPESTFPANFQAETLEAGENATLSFAGVGPAEPANISIQSITTGVGVPIDPTGVMGQIEVTLNIIRGDRDLDHVDVLIGGEVVASQTFAPPAPGGAEAISNDETVVLNVLTNQLRMGADTYVPTIFNGANYISAILYEVGGIPIPTIDVPVVMANPDMLLTSDGMLITGVTSRLNAGGTTVAAGGDVWDTGGFQYDGPIYLSYSKTAQTARWADLDGTCGNGVAASTGTFDTGIVLSNTWACTLVEGDDVGPGTALPVSYAPGATVVGPDGTPVNPPTGWSILGAEFTLPDMAGVDESRWFIISVPGAAVLAPVSTWDVDNLGPTVWINGSSATVVPTAGVSGVVAFNDTWDERWINANFDLITDTPVTLTDGGVGPDNATRAALGYPGCAPVITNAVDLGVTVTDNGTDGHVICATGMDLLGNGPQNIPVSYYFGKDIVAPTVRFHGTAPVAPLAANVPALYHAALSPLGVSATANSSIYNIAAPFNPLYVWGVESLDDRSGFHANANGGVVEAGPVLQTIQRWEGTLPEPNVAVGVAGVRDYLNIILGDNYGRTSTSVGAAAEWTFLGGLADPGIYDYTAVVTDQAGNSTTMGPYNWLVDQIAGPMMSALTLGQLTYTPGMGGIFNFYGSDDLEAMSIQASMDYYADVQSIGAPGTAEMFTLMYAAHATDPLATNQRWDMDFTFATLGPLAGTISALHPSLDLGIIGRLDFTDAVGALPAAFNTFDAPPDADITAGDDDFLPYNATGWIADDAGMNGASLPLSTPFVAADIGGWSATVAEQWLGADIATFMLFGTDLDAAPENDATLVAEHMASPSITAPYFDGVALVVNSGGTITVCAASTTPVFSENPFNRFYSYYFSNPSLGSGTDVCQAPASGDIYHAAAWKLDAFGRPAMLLTDPADAPLGPSIVFP